MGKKWIINLRFAEKNERTRVFLLHSAYNRSNSEHILHKRIPIINLCAKRKAHDNDI